MQKLLLLILLDSVNYFSLFQPDLDIPFIRELTAILLVISHTFQKSDWVNFLNCLMLVFDSNNHF